MSRGWRGWVNVHVTWVYTPNQTNLVHRVACRRVAVLEHSMYSTPGQILQAIGVELVDDGASVPGQDGEGEGACVGIILQQPLNEWTYTRRLRPLGILCGACGSWSRTQQARHTYITTNLAMNHVVVVKQRDVRVQHEGGVYHGPLRVGLQCHYLRGRVNRVRVRGGL